MLCYPGVPGRHKSPSESNFRRIWGVSYPFDMFPILLCGEQNAWISGWRIIYFVMDGCLQHTFLFPLSNRPRRNARRRGWFFLGFRGDTICIPVRLRVVLAQFFYA